MKAIIATILACSLTMGASHAVAEEDSEQTIRRVFIDQVKPDQHAAFLALSEEWNQCLKANDAEHGWSAWEAQTGQMYRYAFVVDGAGWARFDQRDPAHKTCYEQFAARYTATIESAHSSFDSRIESLSDDMDGEFRVVLVISFDLKDPRKFFETVARFTAAAREAGYTHPHQWWQTRGGDSGANFYLVIAFENFASLDASPGFWDAVKSHLGEEELDRMRSESSAAIDRSWEDIWTWSEELSYTPGD